MCSRSRPLKKAGLDDQGSRHARALRWTGELGITSLLSLHQLLQVAPDNGAGLLEALAPIKASLHKVRLASQLKKAVGEEAATHRSLVPRDTAELYWWALDNPEAQSGHDSRPQLMRPIAE